MLLKRCRQRNNINTKKILPKPRNRLVSLVEAKGWPIIAPKKLPILELFSAAKK